MKDKLCLYPHLGLTLEAFGEVRLCTSAMNVEFDLKHDEINLNEVLNHSKFQSHRENLESGIFPASCRSCKKVEDSGVKSKREIFTEKRLKKYGSSKLEAILSQEKKKPMHLSIGFSNSCNLKCSMCSSKYSQAWKNDEIAFSELSKHPIESFDHFQMNQHNIAELAELSEECSDIYIKGGEPFYSIEAINFLKQLKLKKRRPHIFVQTNGTVVSDEVKDLVEGLNIEVGISIDGVEETYEWIRGFSYNQILKNINELSLLKTDHNLSLDFTSSIFNIVNLADSMMTFNKMLSENSRIGHLSLFSIARQTRNSFAGLPLEFRKNILDSIKKLSNFSIESFEVLEKSLETKQLSTAEQLITADWISFLERSRGKIPGRENSDFSAWLEGERR